MRSRRRGPCATTGCRPCSPLTATAPRPWLASELLTGPTLAERIAADGPLADDELRALARGLAEALVAVHAAGVVHRDVTPANVVLGADGPVLVDFGIALVPDATTLTMTGTVVGTAGWLAPELLRDDEASDAADVWSWGVVLAFAATGRAPAAGSRAEVVLRRVLDGDLDLEGLPGWLDGLVRRCLEQHPARRPTAEELVAALDPSGRAGALTEVLTTTEAAPRPPTAVLPAPAPPPLGPFPAAEPSPRPRRLATRGAVVAAGLVLGLVAEPLLVLLVIVVMLLVAIGLRLRAEARSEAARPPVTAGTLVLTAAVATVAALTQIVGLLFALIGFVGLIVLFFALGGDLG